jgi:hypothetical protein
MNKIDCSKGYKLYNLENGETSKKIWKTYNGAMKNCTAKDVILSVSNLEETINWMKSHPDYCFLRLHMKTSSLELIEDDDIREELRKKII